MLSHVFDIHACMCMPPHMCLTGTCIYCNIHMRMHMSATSDVLKGRIPGMARSQVTLRCTYVQTHINIYIHINIRHFLSRTVSNPLVVLQPLCPNGVRSDLQTNEVACNLAAIVYRSSYGKHVCMYVSMYACMHVCKHVCMYVSM